MMTIKFNDKPIVLDKKISLTEMLEQHHNHEQHFSIAINRNFIPRSQYNMTFLNDGDTIETITPMQGG